MQHWQSATTRKNTQEPQKPSSPRPDQLRALVLDYLYHKSYISTARSFVRESAIQHFDSDSDGDVLMCNPSDDKGSPTPESRDVLAETLEERLAVAQRRREIRTSILSGRIDEAASLLKEYFPAVLSDEQDVDVLSEHPASAQKMNYIPSTATDPATVALNLRIQAFIEASRTIPLPYASSSKPSAGNASLHRAFPMESRTSAPRDSKAEPGNRHLDLLHRAQGLYSEVQCLPSPSDRVAFLRELSEVTAILAYIEPERSSLAPYFTFERRESVADLVDAAILYRLHQLSISKIELVARNTSAIWSSLHDLDIKPPPMSKWPNGVNLPPLGDEPSTGAGKSSERTSSTSAKGSCSEKQTNEPVPYFDLTRYLNAKA
ncbi:hypothetical protein K474DRAFT_1702620 [Panus rudis PR-1116 ss-1]|nr:hypothetical protein K474DRAFT_1702620 [Panus rudis PR-1116 ss-1]